jgi:hypothetical protein
MLTASYIFLTEFCEQFKKEFRTRSKKTFNDNASDDLKYKAYNPDEPMNDDVTAADIYIWLDLVKETYANMVSDEKNKQIKGDRLQEFLKNLALPA